MFLAWESKRGRGASFPGTDASVNALLGSAGSVQQKAVGERIAIIDIDRVVAGDARPAGDARQDRRPVADARLALHPAVEQRADDALVHKTVADLEASLADELRHARR